jgi:hypothetical protein
MAIKLIANYAKRLGLPGYSSHQFSVSVETELTQVTDLAGESARLYQSLQQAVDGQMQAPGFVPPDGYGLENGQQSANGANRNGHSDQSRNGHVPNRRNGDWQCSDKQRGLIDKIVSENGLDRGAIDDLACEMFGHGVKALNRLEASGFIDELLERHGKPRRNGYRGTAGKPMIALVEPAPTPAPAPTRTIEELITTVSASRLTTWAQCRLKFFFRYLSGIQKPTTPALFYGTAMHAVLQQWNLARWRKQPLSFEVLQELFTQCWAEQPPGIPWQGEEDEARQSAAALLAAYFLETPIPGDERPEGVEVGVEADLSTHGLPTLVGVLDLVRANRIIVDFKTAARSPEPTMLGHTTELQITAYGVLYRAATDQKESGVELHHLIKTKAPKIVVTAFAPISERQITRLYRVIEAYVTGVQHEDFIPAPGLQCAACEFFAECRAWAGKESP